MLLDTNQTFPPNGNILPERRVNSGRQLVVTKRSNGLYEYTVMEADTLIAYGVNVVESTLALTLEELLEWL